MFDCRVALALAASFIHYYILQSSMSSVYASLYYIRTELFSSIITSIKIEIHLQRNSFQTAERPEPTVVVQ